MIWRINEQQQIVPIEQFTMLFTSIGHIAVYKLGSDIVIETNDMMSMGTFREKFEKEVVPKIKKELNLPQLDIRKLKTRISDKKDGKE
jgi:hypothetical protein